MEELSREYAGQVNFLWVYGSEAHPEEYPFQAGFESKDLGWSHPYTISTSMEQRAERANWMKTDPEPDFEIPMAMDFINHQTEPDNAIRNAYRGGGYYSGYVVDCDGIVKRAHSWAWYAPGGEWWGLPLAPVEQLRAWITAYLSDPPSCYTGEVNPPGPDAGVDPNPGPDAGVDPNPGPDADPGTGDPNDPRGCSAAGGQGRAPLPLGLALLGLLTLSLLRRRQRLHRHQSMRPRTKL